MVSGPDTGRDRSHTSRPPGVGILPALGAACLILWHLLATPFIGKRRLRWGTAGTEATDPLHGDDLVAEPKWSHTLGCSIEAPPGRVWPWIAQIGQRRAGFYTYQTLENLVGCRITNTTKILPEFQYPSVGDHVFLHPTAPPLRVEIVDPPHALVLVGSPATTGEEGPWGKSTWQFVVRQGADRASRLLIRGRYDHALDCRSRLTFGRFTIEPVSFVMSRRMMREIKRLAEDSSR